MKVTTYRWANDGTMSDKLITIIVQWTYVSSITVNNISHTCIYYEW